MTDFVDRVLNGKFEHAPTDDAFLRLVVSELAIRQETLPIEDRTFQVDNFTQFLLNIQSSEKILEIMKFSLGEHKIIFDQSCKNFVSITQRLKPLVFGYDETDREFVHNTDYASWTKDVNGIFRP